MNVSVEEVAQRAVIELARCNGRINALADKLASAVMSQRVQRGVEIEALHHLLDEPPEVIRADVIESHPVGRKEPAVGGIRRPTVRRALDVAAHGDL